VIGAPVPEGLRSSRIEQPTVRPDWAYHVHVGQVIQNHDRSSVRTARTRRFVSCDGSSPSFRKIKAQEVSTVRSLIRSRSAMPAFERPSAINERISRSRAVNLLSGEAGRRRCISLATIVGSRTHSPSLTRCMASIKTAMSETRCLSRYPS
jgi:hypothetical protein